MSVQVSPNSPELVFEIDFDTDPGSTPRTYTDVTTDVRSLSCTRSGRNSELQRTEPGTLTAVLDNRHGFYDPANTTSPYYPGVRRVRWCRVSAVWAGVTYRRWTGLIEVWSQTWPAAGRDAVVTITATDALKVLNLFDLDGVSFTSQLSSARVSSVLTEAGITASSVETGLTTVAASGPYTAGGMSALAHLIEVEQSENGLLFADGSGQVVFQNRHHRILEADSVVAVDVIGDADGEIPYRVANLDLDDGFLWNTVVVTPDGGTEETSTDTASIAVHFERRLTRAILSASQTDALNTAQFLVQRYADPTSRIPKLEVICAKATGKWPVVLAAENSDRFTWHRSAVADITMDVFVERVSDTVVPGQEWRVAFDLSPAVDQEGWVAGDAALSLAGDTTRAVY